jgi:hypothetical protein
MRGILFGGFLSILARFVHSSERPKVKVMGNFGKQETANKIQM